MKKQIESVSTQMDDLDDYKSMLLAHYLFGVLKGLTSMAKAPDLNTWKGIEKQIKSLKK